MHKVKKRNHSTTFLALFKKIAYNAISILHRLRLIWNRWKNV